MTQQSFIKIFVSNNTLLVLAALFCGFSQSLQAKEPIVVWHKSMHETASIALLNHVLDASKANYGDFELISSPPITQGRAFIELANSGSIDLMTGAPSLYRENNTTMVPIPINRGLLGVRICLIKKGTQEKFENVKTVTDLIDKNISIGQGEHWPDTIVLEANGLSVLRNALHKNLYEMLRAGRFDCFARAISEIDDELAVYGKEGLEVEKSIAIVYRLPLLFWVNPSNTKLIERLKIGMLKSVLDESYYSINQQHFEAALKKYEIENRQIIYLDNPLQSTKIAAIDDALWHPILNEFSSN